MVFTANKRYRMSRNIKRSHETKLGSVEHLRAVSETVLEQEDLKVCWCFLCISRYVLPRPHRSFSDTISFIFSILVVAVCTPGSGTNGLSRLFAGASLVGVNEPGREFNLTSLWFRCRECVECRLPTVTCVTCQTFIWMWRSRKYEHQVRGNRPCRC